MPILPPRLELGDTLALVSPASPPFDPAVIDESVTALEQMGFKVKLGRHARQRRGFLAGTDRERAADLMQMFTDSRVRGIVCVRGGYGSGRLLSLLDYEGIRANAKIFVGFSDITVLHCAFLKKANLLTFHGPMAASHSSPSDNTEFSRQAWLRILTEPVAAGSVRKEYTNDTVSIITPGKVSGQLIGGNLSLLATTIGTPFQPSFRGKILFLEDVNERPYRVDRLLTHLLNAGLLQQVAGIAIGLCHECLDPVAKKTDEYRQTIRDVFQERLKPLKIPVVLGLPFGHVPHNTTLPFGGRATVDANAGDLIITEAAVS